MENLKITFRLGTPAILNRLTTIDSILLSAYYAYASKKGKHFDFDEEHKSVDFIEKKHGVFSGSIWYVEKNAEILLDFRTKIGTCEHEKLRSVYGNNIKKEIRTTFKNALEEDETIFVNALYFYIKANKEKTEELLKEQVKYIGKDRKLGYGEVVDIIVESTKEDKGYMLNRRTASKPLPVSDFDIESKKIAFNRRSAPYWLRKDLEQCYMPTMNLIESDDKSFKQNFNVVEMDYISNVDFLHEKSLDVNCIKDESISFKEANYKDILISKKDSFRLTSENKDKLCCYGDSVVDSGIVGDVKGFLKKKSKRFKDFTQISHNDFIGEKAIWCIDNFMEVAYSYVDNHQWSFLQGKRKKEDMTINVCLNDLSKFKPPFSINLKDTQNAQHVSFKGRVSISNAWFYLQYGNETLMVDGQSINEAKEDIYLLLEKYPKLSKNHFLGNHLGSYHIDVKKDEILNDIFEFQKKYDKNCRKLLSIIAY